MQRIAIIIALMILGYFLIKRITKSLFGSSEIQEVERKKKPADADLVKDPQCGSYFLKQSGVKGVLEGKVILFCSEECYDKYRKRQIRQ